MVIFKTHSWNRDELYDWNIATGTKILYKISKWWMISKSWKGCCNKKTEAATAYRNCVWRYLMNRDEHTMHDVCMQAYNGKDGSFVFHAGHSGRHKEAGDLSVSFPLAFKARCCAWPWSSADRESSPYFSFETDLANERYHSVYLRSARVSFSLGNIFRPPSKSIGNEYLANAVAISFRFVFRFYLNVCSFIPLLLVLLCME